MRLLYVKIPILRVTVRAEEPLELAVYRGVEEFLREVRYTRNRVVDVYERAHVRLYNYFTGEEYDVDTLVEYREEVREGLSWRPGPYAVRFRVRLIDPFWGREKVVEARAIAELIPFFAETRLEEGDPLPIEVVEFRGRRFTRVISPLAMVPTSWIPFTPEGGVRLKLDIPIEVGRRRGGSPRQGCGGYRYITEFLGEKGED